jgi:hypothetical protein
MVTNIPDPTVRDTTQDRTWINAPNGWNKQQAFDMVSNIPDPTVRDTTQNNTYQGPLINHEKTVGGYQANQAGTIAPTTLRQLIQNNTYQGPLINHGKTVGGYQAAQAGTIAPTTLRQLTENTTANGPPVLHEGGKTRGRADANNSLVNIGKDYANTVRDGGAPTTSNYEKAPTYEHTMVQMCEPIQINRDLYGSMPGQRPLQCVPTMYTRVAQPLDQNSWRWDSHVADNLAGNIFVNNTQHKFVTY